MDKRRLIIDGVEIPLSEGVNIPINKSIVDITQPDKRTSDFTKEFLIPASKEANKVFNHIWDINVQSTFNPNLKVDATYLEGNDTIVEGFVRLLDIKETDKQERFYQIQLLGSISNIFREFGDKELDDQGMNWQELDHEYTRDNQQLSWDTSYELNGVVTPFSLGSGYVYGQVDYGRHTYSYIYEVTDMIPQTYAREILLRMFQDAGYTWNSAFLDSTEFKSLVVTANQSGDFGLTEAQIIERQFEANTVQMLTSGNNTVSVAQALNQNGGTADRLINTVEVNDPSGAYDPATGIWTAPANGYYALQQTVDITATFTPTAQTEPFSVLNGSVLVYVTIQKRSTVGTFANQWQTIGAEGVNLGASLIPPAGKTTTGSTYADNEYQSQPFVITYTGATVNWSASNPRNYNPPKTFVCNAPYFQQFLAGDEVRVMIQSKWERDLLNDVNGVPFGASDGWFIGLLDNTKTTDGAVTLNLSNSEFKNQILNPQLVEEAILEYEQIVPKKIKQKDYFKGLINMFNLFIQPDPDDPRILNIEPRNDFYNNEIEDFSELWATDQPMTSKPMGALDSKEYDYTYKADKDYYNVEYTSEYDRIYANREFEVENDFETATKKTEVVFSPSPSAGYVASDRVVPIIIKLDNAQQIQPIDSNIRIMYYGGLKSCNQNWIHRRLNNPLADDYLSTYPYVGMWDDPFNPVNTLDFGVPRKIFWDNTWHTVNATDNNLFNRFYKQYIEEIIDPQSRLVTGYFWLSSSQIRKIDFKKLYYWNNAYYRLNKVIDYKKDQLTKCEFLKLNFADPFVLNIVPIGGGKNATIGDESLPIFNDNIQKDFNNFDPSSGTVLGDNNVIDPTSRNVSVQGDSNFVGGNTKNITISGSKNAIAPNLENVTLINTNGVAVLESNKTYIGSILIESLTDFHSGFRVIELGQEFTITKNKQSTNFGILELEGTLDVEGELILEI